jgi:hypothetical protein
MSGIVQRRKYNNAEEDIDDQQGDLKDDTSLLTLMEEILLLGLKDSEVLLI